MRSRIIEIILPRTNGHEPIARPYINQRLTVANSERLVANDNDFVSRVRIVFIA